MAKEIKLEYYVLNHDFNGDKIYQFNIFDNYYVYHGALKAVVQYMTKAIDYKAYVKELRSVIMHEMWSRCQYEIAVGGLFSKEDKYQKIDVFYQVEKNMEVIAMYVYMTAKEYFYNEDTMNTEIDAEALRKHVWYDENKHEMFNTREEAVAAITDEDLVDGGVEERYVYENWYIKEYVSRY